MVAAVLRGMKIGHLQLLGIGISCFIGGFVLWLCDNAFCDTLAAWRARVGPCAPLLQLHAWWHIGVGIGAYCYTLFLVMLYLQEERDVTAKVTFFRSFLPRVEILKDVDKAQ